MPRMHSSIMERASDALRRSSIRLLSLNSGHGDLNLIISDLKELRKSYKRVTNAKKLAWDDMSKWAVREKNMALQETFHYLSELSDLFFEAQREFIGGIKRLQQYFEMILESEVHLDKSISYLETCEKNELKIRKEIAKSNVRSAYVDDRLETLNERQAHAVASIATAHQEVEKKTVENEVLKIVKVKEGLADFSESCLEVAHKTSVIFSAHAEVVDCLPDARASQLEDLKYLGSEISQRAVSRAKHDVHCYKRQSERANAPPPPYTSNPSSPVSSSQLSTPLTSPPYFNSSDHHRYCEIPEYSENQRGATYDVPPRDNYENLNGATGGSLANCGR